MKLLIIENEEDVLSFLKSNLSTRGFIIDGAKTGQAGLTLVETNIYDLIILDLNLPDLNGCKICETLRHDGLMIPILILTANEEINSKITLLNMGADDYMIKPYSLDELVSRIKALLRRPLEIRSHLLVTQDIKLDEEKQIVTCKGKEIYLTRKEFLILNYMMSRPNSVISRGEMMEHVWDMEANFFSKTIETHILHLRKKLDSNHTKHLIKTIPGRGYKLG